MSAARDSETARLLLAEIIREASDLSNLLNRTTIRHGAAGPPAYLVSVETAFREIGVASREAYRKANPPAPPPQQRDNTL
jgi:hypothetical protein